MNRNERRARASNDRANARKAEARERASKRNEAEAIKFALSNGTSTDNIMTVELVDGSPGSNRALLIMNDNDMDVPLFEKALAEAAKSDPNLLMNYGDDPRWDTNMRVAMGILSGVLAEGGSNRGQMLGTLCQYLKARMPSLREISYRLYRGVGGTGVYGMSAVTVTHWA